MSDSRERGLNPDIGLREREPMAFKNIHLVTPRFARRYGLEVDCPVFLSDTDSRMDQRPMIYEVGKVIETAPLPKRFTGSSTSLREIGDRTFVVNSRPKFGLGYDEHPRYVMTNGCEFWGNVRIRGWVAIVEPLGRVVEHDDYFFAYNRVTDKLRVKEILAHCFPGSCRDLPPLQEGVVVGPFGDGVYRPICGTEIHHDTAKFETFGFRIPYDGAHPIFEGF